MFDTETGRDPYEDGNIVLAGIGGGYWLLAGENHLNALLANNAPYPKPVHCIVFESEFDLMRALPAGQTKESLWAIHPDIVARLERHDELIKISLPDGL